MSEDSARGDRWRGGVWADLLSYGGQGPVLGQSPDQGPHTSRPRRPGSGSPDWISLTLRRMATSCFASGVSVSKASGRSQRRRGTTRYTYKLRASGPALVIDL